MLRGLTSVGTSNKVRTVGALPAERSAGHIDCQAGIGLAVHLAMEVSGICGPTLDGILLSIGLGSRFAAEFLRRVGWIGQYVLVKCADTRLFRVRTVSLSPCEVPELMRGLRALRALAHPRNRGSGRTVNDPPLQRGRIIDLACDLSQRCSCLGPA